MRLGEPSEPSEEYQVYRLEAVTLYIHSSCHSAIEGHSIQLELERVLFGKKLVLLGFKMENE